MEKKVSENKIENYLIEQAKCNNCITFKFTSPSMKGVPDRIIIDTIGRTHYVELKTNVGKLSQSQCVILKRMLKQNALAYVVNSKHNIDLLYKHINAGENDIPDAIHPSNFFTKTITPSTFTIQTLERT